MRSKIIVAATITAAAYLVMRVAVLLRCQYILSNSTVKGTIEREIIIMYPFPNITSDLASS